MHIYLSCHARLPPHTRPPHTPHFAHTLQPLTHTCIPSTFCCCPLLAAIIICCLHGLIPALLPHSCTSFVMHQLQHIRARWPTSTWALTCAPPKPLTLLSTIKHSPSLFHATAPARAQCGSATHNARRRNTQAFLIATRRRSTLAHRTHSGAVAAAHARHLSLAWHMFYPLGRKRHMVAGLSWHWRDNSLARASCRAQARWQTTLHLSLGGGAQRQNKRALKDIRHGKDARRPACPGLIVIGMVKPCD